MRIAVIGPGAVGGYFGGRLAQSGEDVYFLAHGRTLAAMREHGLRVESTKGDFTLSKVNVAENASEVGAVDLVLVCVKAWQVPELGSTVKPLLGPETIVLPLENGVEATEQLAEFTGDRRVLVGVCGLMSTVVEPGHIKHFGLEPFITLGERDNSHTPRTERLMNSFTKAAIKATNPTDIYVRLWMKYLFITSVSGVGSVSRAAVGVLRETPATRELLRRSITELDQLAKASGVKMPETAVNDTLAVVDGMPPTGTTSMMRDLLEGRPSELDSLVGAVGRIGRKHGVPTPVNETIYAALLPSELRARGQLKFDRM
jgi:2-dehydropantoate 2-reductase